MKNWDKADKQQKLKNKNITLGQNRLPLPIASLMAPLCCHAFIFNICWSSRIAIIPPGFFRTSLYKSSKRKLRAQWNFKLLWIQSRNGAFVARALIFDILVKITRMGLNYFQGFLKGAWIFAQQWLKLIKNWARFKTDGKNVSFISNWFLKMFFSAPFGQLWSCAF